MNWQEKVNFRDLLKEYNLDADDELAEVERVKPLWIERFNSIPCLESFIPSIKKVKTEAQFNKLLNRIYDFCDANRIWVEL
jgi:hypothetical protein